MNRNIKSYEVGNTIKFTCISSGMSASPIFSTLLDGDETIVGSVSATDSGAGHYYANHLMPNTPGYYVNRWNFTVSALSYSAARKFQVVRTEVD